MKFVIVYLSISLPCSHFVSSRKAALYDKTKNGCVGNMYPKGPSQWKYMYGSCKLTVSISSLRNNWLDWWTPCTVPALILFAASFPMNTRRLAWLNQALSCTSSGVMVCWRVFVSAERVFPTEFPSKNSDKGKQWKTLQKRRMVENWNCHVCDLAWSTTGTFFFFCSPDCYWFYLVPVDIL